MISTVIFNREERKMKKMSRFFGLAAIAAMTLASCQKESLAPASEAKMVEMTVHGGPDALTKTVLQEDGTVLWGEGEKLVVFQTVGETTTFATSSEGVTNDGGQTMTFGVAFAENPDASAFTYNAVYPASIFITEDKPSVDAIKTNFPSIQKPTATSYDAAADLLIAKPLEATEQPSDLLLAFHRVAGIGKMTIKNLASTANVREVVFTAKHAGEEAAAPILAGRTRVNLTEGTAEYGYNSPTNSLKLDYSGQTIAANGMTAYFASLPFALAEGDSFTVAVTTTDGKVFTKEVSLPAGKTLAVKSGRSSTFSVNMTGAEEEEVADLEGEYIFIGKTTSDWRYMTPQVSTGSTPFILVNETGVTLAADKLDLTSSATNFPTVTDTWTVEKSGDNYAIKSKGGKYVSWPGTGNSATLADDPYELTISKKENGSFEIVSVADNNRKFGFNSGSPRFAFYTSTQADIYMIPYVANTKPVIVPDATEITVEAAGSEDYIIKLTCENLTDAPSAVSSVDWIVVDDIVEDQLDLVISENTGEARTGTVTISATGAEDVVITVNQKAKPVDNYLFKKVTTVTSGKQYLIVAPGNGDETLKVATPITANYGYLQIESVTPNADGYIGQETLDNAFVFTAESNGYTIKQSDDRYLYQTGTYNSFNVTATPSSGHIFTVAANADGTIVITNVAMSKYMQYSYTHTSYGSYANEQGNAVLPMLYELISDEGGETPGGDDPDPTVTEKFVKVTSASNLTDGQYLIVYEDGELAMSDALDESNNTIAVNISNGTIEANETTKAHMFTISVAKGTIVGPNGSYIGKTADSNGMDVKTTELTNTITINGTDVDILSSGGAYLRYNASSGQERFRYYKSASYTGQKAIQLYKYTDN